MLGPAWASLFRRLPPGLHDTLVMITSTGAEVMIQKILILEEDYIVFRGRMSGVQDSGLVMMMPYDQISNLAIAKRILEPELRQIFKGSDFVVSGTDGPAVHENATTASAAEEKKNVAEQPRPEPVVKEPTPAIVTHEEAKEPEPAGKPIQPSK